MSEQPRRRVIPLKLDALKKPSPQAKSKWSRVQQSAEEDTSQLQIPTSTTSKIIKEVKSAVKFQQQLKRFRQDKQDMTKLYYEELLDKSVIASNSKELSLPVYIITYLLIPFILFIANCLCLVNLVVKNYIDIGEWSESNRDWTEKLDVFIGVVFVIEAWYNWQMHNGSLYQKLMHPDRLVELINVFEIFWFVAGGVKNLVLIFLRTVRALRVRKVRRQFRNTVINIKKLLIKKKDTDMFYEINDEFDEDKLGSFLIDSIVEFFSGIMFQSALILAVDECLNYNGFEEGEVSGKLGYVGVWYYVIVSFSTIGYGDIYPQVTSSRLFMTVLLIVNITYMSNFLTTLLEQIYNQSPYVTTYDFHNHVVIVGNVPDPYLFRFLSELIEYDNLQSSSKVFGGMKVIIVGTNDPSPDIRNICSFYSENARYDNEVVYLKADIFGDNIHWFRQCSLINCRIFFAFSEGIGDIAHQNDLEIAFITRFVKHWHPDLQCYLVLQSAFKQVIQADSLFHDITIISSTEFNEIVMGVSVENIGFSAFLQHLLSIKMKQIPLQIHQLIDDDQFQRDYIRDMEQEMYTIELNAEFEGMTFQELFKLFYFNGFTVGENEEENRTQSRFMGYSDTEQDRVATLIGIETFEDQLNQLWKNMLNGSDHQVQQENVDEGPIGFVTQTLEEDTQRKSKILINPQNYIIKQGDIAYLISEDISAAERCRLMKRNSKPWEQHELNLQRLQAFRPEQEDLLQNWWISEQKRKFEEAQKSFGVNNVRRLSATPLKRGSTHLLSSDMMRKIYDFTLLEFPETPLTNHTVIIGSFAAFQRMVPIIRKYSQRALALFTEDKFDLFKWSTLQNECKHLYYFKGDFHNVHHIALLSIPNSHQVLIMSSHSDDLFEDSVALCLARVIHEYFDQSSMLVELKDDSTVSFFSKNPLFKNSSVSVTPFLWPAFQQGSIHLSSCLFGLLARCVFNPNWLHFLNKLFLPSDDKDESNKNIGCLHLNEQIVQNCYFFGILQYLLIENKPSAIAVALIKFQIKSSYKRKLYSKIIFGAQSEFDSIQDRPSGQTKLFDNKRLKEVSLLQVAGRLLGDRFILTNPSFYTPIEVHDFVLVIGDLEISELKAQLLHNSSTLKVIKEEDQSQRVTDRVNNEPLLALNENQSRPPAFFIKHIQELDDSHFNFNQIHEEPQINLLLGTDEVYHNQSEPEHEQFALEEQVTDVNIQTLPSNVRPDLYADARKRIQFKMRILKQLRSQIAFFEEIHDYV